MGGKKYKQHNEVLEQTSYHITQPSREKKLIKAILSCEWNVRGKKFKIILQGVFYSERGLKMYFWEVFHLHSDIYKTWCFYQQSIPIEFIPGIYYIQFF